MTKFIFAIALTLLVAKNIQPICAEYKSSIALRGAAFVPTADRFKDIYGDVGANYQIEACTDLTAHLDGWLNANWFMKHGKSDSLHDPTRVNIANLSLGIKFPYRINNAFTLYVGIGPSLGIIWLKNRSKFTHQNVAKPVIGGMLKSGVYCFLSDRIFLDFFIDYLYQPALFYHTVNIGGITAGVGIGSKF